MTLHSIGGGSRISIHAPREGSDRATVFAPSASASFLSTLPARGATPARDRYGWIG